MGKISFGNFSYMEYEGDYTIDKMRNASKIDDILHVVMVISNPCNYSKRYKLAREFQARMALTKGIQFYTVELIFPGQSYQVTDSSNPNHLQLQTKVALWPKENLINIAARHLFPKDWKAMAYIDADITFDDEMWVENTLKALSLCDIIQLFEQTYDEDMNEKPLRIYSSSMSQYCQKQERCTFIDSCHYWHPGYAWGMTRSCFDQLGGLFDKSIVGSGDDNLMRSLIGEVSWITSLSDESTDGYREALKEWALRFEGLRAGYIPGVIHHAWHGTAENRKYSSRWVILAKHQYDPSLHIVQDEMGINIPSEKFPEGLAEDIMNYFRERKEDD